MLLPHSNAARVSYEWDEVKGFDDVVVVYEPPVPNDRGGSCHADYYQVKFHVTQSHQIQASDLMAPTFIGTSTVSLLERLKTTQEKMQAQDQPYRLILVTPWHIDSKDILGSLVSNNAGEIRLDRLLKGGSKSAMGHLRNEWADHLKIPVAELPEMLKPLRVWAGFGTLSHVNEQLKSILPVAGLKPLSDSSISSAYDDLIRKLVRAGKNSFSATDMRAICRNEGLWVGASGDRHGDRDIGIRSFIRRAEYMEDDTEAMLDLVPYFSGRRITNPGLWANEIIRDVRAFLADVVRPGKTYRIHLDTHTSVAMLAGYLLDSKAGVSVAPMQKTLYGKEVWKAGIAADPRESPGWSFTKVGKDSDAGDLAIALSITHDATRDVEAYLSASGLRVRELLNATVEGGPSSTAILDGDHVFRLIQELTATLRQKRVADMRVIHLFIAGPNAFSFVLGQHARAFGQCRLYEYDFETSQLGAYEPSLEFPVENDVNAREATGG